MFGATTFFMERTGNHINFHGLWQELSDHTLDLRVQHESIDRLFSFYDTTKATLEIYQVHIRSVLLCFSKIFSHDR